MPTPLIETISRATLNKLASMYDSAKVDLDIAKGRRSFLADGIIPTDIFAISGSGATLRTNRGRMIDLAAMTVNCILGQNDPWVKLNQIGYLLSDRPSFHTTKFGSELYYEVPRRLAQLSIGGIVTPAISHRQCNGSDAVELAIAAAWKAAAGRTLLISFDGSYHGQNLTSYAASALQRKHVFWVDPPDVKFVHGPPDDVSDHDMVDSESDVLNDLDAVAKSAFAVVLEPVQVNNGVRRFSPQFLRKLRAWCTLNNICLIFDEVQSGFGWLGKLTAAEKYGVTPDVLAMSKALTAGNGPLALTVASQRYRRLDYRTTTKTQGADVRALVAARSVLDRLLGIPEEAIPEFVIGDLRLELREGLLSTVPARSLHLRSMVEELVAGSGGVASSFRGDGFIWGIDVVNRRGQLSVRRAQDIASACLANGLLIRQAGPTLIIKPPINVTGSELDEGLGILRAAIKANASRNGGYYRHDGKQLESHTRH